MQNQQKSNPSELFLARVRSQLLKMRGLEGDITDFPSDVAEALQEISKQLDSDFSSIGHGHLSHEARLTAYLMAAEKLGEKMCHGTLTESSTRKFWQEVVQDFYQNNHWGLVLTHQPPPKLITNPVRHEIWPYIWGFFQTAILMKWVVYYFGLEMSRAPTPEYTVIFYGLLGFTILSMTFTTWRLMKKEKKDNDKINT